jgi:hypothetical protein
MDFNCCFCWKSCNGTSCDTKFHNGYGKFNNNSNTKHNRNLSNRNIWRHAIFRNRFQRHTNRKPRSICNVCSNRCNKRLQLQPGQTRCRDHQHHRFNTHYYYYLCYQLVVCLLAITPALGQTGNTNVNANPQASSFGSVTNQAVQINQGSFNQQSLGPGLICSGPTMVFTPFYIGNSQFNEQIISGNYGIQLSFSVPLDKEAVNLCKELGRSKLSKERLDYELVRILKCAEFYKAGFIIHPESPYAPVCADVIPIAAVTTLKPFSPSTSVFVSKPE